MAAAPPSALFSPIAPSLILFLGGWLRGRERDEGGKARRCLQEGCVPGPGLRRQWWRRSQDVRRLGDQFEHGQIEAVEFVRPREEDVDHAPTKGDHPEAIADCRRRRSGFPYRIGRGAAATAVATPLRQFRNVV